jgi:oligopeptidase B
MSVPYKKDGYFYYNRTEEGEEYPIYCRKKGSLEASEEIMLNVNRMAKGHDFFAVGGRAISYHQDLLAYSVDTVGRRIYSIHFKNLMSNKKLKDRMEKVTGNIAWANDNRTLFYTRQDPTTLRWNRVYKHRLGTDPSDDELVYEETDETFSCHVSKTKSKRYIIIASDQTLTSEYRFLDANNPDGDFQVVLPRKRGHEYSVDHYKDHFYIRTNDGAKNFKLIRTHVDHTRREYWEEIIPHRNDVFFEGMEIFRKYLVAVERKNGLKQIRIKPWSGEEEHYLDFGEPTYTVSPTDNYDFETKLLRYRYTSLVTPNSVYDYDMATRKRKLLKREEVLGGFSPDNYKSERIHAKAKDGTKVAISLVYRKGLKKDGINPLLLYGYGSYGSSMNPRLDAYGISLLDRGFTYAMAHIRGGQEMGRQWYEDGKLLRKKNTFTDFIACGEYLIEQQYTSRDKLFVRGGSAGGLLIGAVLNMQPDLFKGAVADGPVVDADVVDQAGEECARC